MTPDRRSLRPGRLRRDRGSATVLVLALAAALGASGAVLTGVATVAVARHRAAAAADLAALAAAGRAGRGDPAACAAAARVAAAHRVTLVRCTPDPAAVGVVEVAVRAQPAGWAGRFGAATARARAGPAAPVP